MQSARFCERPVLSMSVQTRAGLVRPIAHPPVSWPAKHPASHLSTTQPATQDFQPAAEPATQPARRALDQPGRYICTHIHTCIHAHAYLHTYMRTSAPIQEASCHVGWCLARWGEGEGRVTTLVDASRGWAPTYPPLPTPTHPPGAHKVRVLCEQPRGRQTRRVAVPQPILAPSRQALTKSRTL